MTIMNNYLLLLIINRDYRQTTKIENFDRLPKKIVTFVPKTYDPSPPPPPLVFFNGRARETRERGEEVSSPYLSSRVLEISSLRQRKKNRCYDTVHLVFLEISEYLDWSAMSCNSSVGNYVCISLTVHATVLILLLFRASSDPKRPRPTSTDQQRDPL